MSAAVEVVFERENRWTLWRRQLLAIVSLEAGRNLLGRRALFVYLLALGPIVLLALRLVLPIPERGIDRMGGSTVLYAMLFRTFFLRFAIFFGCLGVFTRLFRGDVLERTLHYYLLCPVRRELLVLGKYLSGVLSTGLIFSASTILSLALLYLPGGWALVEGQFLGGPALGHLFGYVGVTILGCVGYGAVFLLMGLWFRNPIIPAAVVLGWESINFLLPAALKKISVIYYLESLCPVPIPEGPFTILADPAPLWMAGPGLLLLSLAALGLACLRVRYMEIGYGED